MLTYMTDRFHLSPISNRRSIETKGIQAGGSLKSPGVVHLCDYQLIPATAEYLLEHWGREWEMIDVWAVNMGPYWDLCCQGSIEGWKMVSCPILHGDLELLFTADSDSLVARVARMTP